VVGGSALHERNDQRPTTSLRVRRRICSKTASWRSKIALSYRMSEPRRATDPADGAPVGIDDRDRSSRIEQLLLTGLDQYFSGRYEEAIDIWTRVAFLERRNGRARAYIERARGALAERQRASDELIAAARTALDAGQVAEARQLLTDAISDGAAGDTAALLLERLHRVGVPRTAGHTAQAIPVVAPASPFASQGWTSTIVASTAVVVAVLVGGRMLTASLAEWPATGPAVSAHVDAPPSIGSGDVTLARARQLHAAGRPREALRVLDSIDLADPAQPSVDGLRGIWQRELLASAGAVVPRASGGPR
jgi:hypothetical protein